MRFVIDFYPSKPFLKGNSFLYSKNGMLCYIEMVYEIVEEKMNVLQIK